MLFKKGDESTEADFNRLQLSRQRLIIHLVNLYKSLERKRAPDETLLSVKRSINDINNGEKTTVDLRNDLQSLVRNNSHVSNKMWSPALKHIDNELQISISRSRQNDISLLTNKRMEKYLPATFLILAYATSIALIMNPATLEIGVSLLIATALTNFAAALIEQSNNEDRYQNVSSEPTISELEDRLQSNKYVIDTFEGTAFDDKTLSDKFKPSSITASKSVLFSKSEPESDKDSIDPSKNDTQEGNPRIG
ncbi:MAG: hypothetical protein P1U74_06490 [Legionellaceae bacterium]|nr:hypothetical protein [Legionellaceae bacterium]